MILTGNAANANYFCSSEYPEREYLPGVKWINVAPRPETSLYANSVGGRNDELHIVVVDIDGSITGTTGAVT